MKKNIYEIFDEFQKAKSVNDKRQILVDNATPDLIGFLQCAFDPRVKFVNIDENAVKYKPSDMPAGMGYTNMGNAIKKTYLFIENHPRRSGNMSETQTNKLFIQMMESLEAREAELYLAMIKKNVKIPHLTKAILEKTFPGIFESPINV